MPTYETTQLLKTDLITCWDFFSNPSNLSVITPPDMNFKIISPDPMTLMYEGMIIRYTVSPLLNIPLEWITEITSVREHDYFVDNQVKGPFKLWHHQHFFTETSAGVEMRDLVEYKLPLGKPGHIFGNLIVKKRVAAIFEFRRAFIERQFNTAQS